MKTIWKYTLSAVSTIEMPMGAQLLTVHEQNNEVCMWALVDASQETEYRSFCVYGTGQEVPKQPMLYIGTALLHSGTLVLHVFERVEKK